MAGTTLTTVIRRRFSTFAVGVARPYTDSRRRGFVTDMRTGLVAGRHVYLTAVSRATHRSGDNNRRSSTCCVSSVSLGGVCGRSPDCGLS